MIIDPWSFLFIFDLDLWGCCYDIYLDLCMLQITLSYHYHACNDVFLSDLVLCKVSTFPYLFSFDEPWSISDLGINYDLRAIGIWGNLGYCQCNLQVWGIHELAYELNREFWGLCKLNQGVGLTLTRHK